eukprot:UN04957
MYVDYPWHVEKKRSKKERQNDLDRCVCFEDPIIPRNMDPEAKSLVLGLLQKQPGARLGSQGPKQIKEHPFFSNIDFALLEYGYLPPPKELARPRDRKALQKFQQTMKTQKIEEAIAKKHKSKTLYNSIKTNSKSSNEKKEDSKQKKLPALVQQALKSFRFKSKRAIQSEILDILKYTEAKSPAYFKHLISKGGK